MLKTTLSLVCSILFASFFASETALGQAEITFQIDLSPQIENNEFDPERDRVQIIGNQFPLGVRQPTELKRTDPETGIYAVTLTFHRAAIGRNLQYNYIMRADGKHMQEEMPKGVRIREGQQTLTPLYFGHFIH